MGAAERLTFLLGACLSAIGWLFAYIVADLTNAPVLYYSLSSPASTDGLHRDVLIHNLSRHLSSPPMKVIIHGTSDNKAGCLSKAPEISGLTWTFLDHSPEYDSSDTTSATVTFANWISPNASFDIRVPTAANCNVSIAFSLASAAGDASASNVRIITDGAESTIIRSYLCILTILLIVFLFVFGFTFVRAYCKPEMSP